MKQDAIQLLKQDHALMRELLDQVSNATDRATKRRVALLEKIEVELKLHAQLEEELFYPAFKEAATKKQDQKLYYEAVEEHHTAESVLTQALKTDAAQPQFAARVKVLKDLVLHHIQEEEKQMFPEAKRVMSKEELQELGMTLAERKANLINGARRTSRNGASKGAGRARNGGRASKRSSGARGRSSARSSSRSSRQASA